MHSSSTEHASIGNFLYAPRPVKPLKLHLGRIESIAETLYATERARGEGEKGGKDALPPGISTKMSALALASPTSQAAIDAHDGSIRELVCLGVPVDMVQRVQSPPVSPVPPNWMQERVEEGPDTVDPFPYAEGVGAGEGSRREGEFRVHKQIEYKTVHRGAPRISVDLYEQVKPKDQRKLRPRST